MKEKTSLVITSIAGSDHPVLNLFARECATRHMPFVVAGDVKSPAGFLIAGCDFLSVKDQKQLPFSVSALIPDKHYSKKNIAYLKAIRDGAEVIIETDDDNIPLPGFWEERHAELQGHLLENKSWVNAYHYFSDTNIWPRGFCLRLLSQKTEQTTINCTGSYYCPVQQGLADRNPDVDAIYRLTMPLPFYFKKNNTIILGNQTICPFNSQNTTWFREAFALLYLPSFCSFRMTDIWRSFVTQRILWTCNWNLAFHNATVYQERNEHNLMKDFEEEISGYVNNEQLMQELVALDLKPGKEFIYDNLRSCYKKIIEKGYIDEKELVILDAWILDIKQLI